MENHYKRLNNKSIKKLNLYKKTGKFLIFFFKWSSVLTIIMTFLFAGIIAFFLIIDNITSDNSENYIAKVNSSKISKNYEETLSDIAKNEMERETQRNNIIADEAEKTKKKLEIKEIHQDFSKWNKNCPKELFIVNNFNPVSESFAPELKLCRGKEVAKEAAEDLDKMICAAKERGIILWISSAYRDFNFQNELFQRRVEAELEKEVIPREEAEKRAEQIVAKAGKSEHITGLAVDFNGVEQNFYLTPEYKWLMDNAHKFGFIERYQKKWASYTGIIFEPWHFRYVGKEVAPKIKESGQSLEEYAMKH